MVMVLVMVMVYHGDDGEEMMMQKVQLVKDQPGGLVMMVMITLSKKRRTGDLGEPILYNDHDDGFDDNDGDGVDDNDDGGDNDGDDARKRDQ